MGSEEPFSFRISLFHLIIPSSNDHDITASKVGKIKGLYDHTFLLKANILDYYKPLLIQSINMSREKQLWINHINSVYKN